MDVQMPVMSGYEATRAIRASDHADAETIHILAMTGCNAFEDIAAAAAAAMNGHLAKPIDGRPVPADCSCILRLTRAAFNEA